MSVRERVLASRLSEKIAENRKYAEKIGVSAVLRRTDDSADINLYESKTIAKNKNFIMGGM